MRVMQVMAGAAKGGAETFYVDLVGALHRVGLEQCAVIRREPERASTLRSIGLQPVELPFRQWFDLGTRRRIRREIQHFRPDIVQTWMNRATGACPRGSFMHVGWLGGYYDLKYFRDCRHLVGVTPDIAAYLVREGWPKERAHYLPTLADDRPEPAVPRQALATPEGVPLVLALGRLHVKKGFDVLLKALAAIPDAHLWLAGEGPLRRELESLTEALGLRSRVRFLGWRTDRAALLAAADICVMPSRYEPFGTVMIEAWAHGAPLIAAAAAGPKGLIRDGEDALLVPIDDVGALEAALRRLIAEPALRERLRAAGRARYEADFTEAAVAGRYLDFYSRILGPRG